MCTRNVSIDARLLVVGCEGLEVRDVPVETRKWSEDTEVSAIQQFDAGIMPLPDAPWERGKCGYKLIQYMACRLPVVASPVGVNREIVEDGVNGFLAATPDEWVIALKQLRDHEELRQSMGMAGRKKVEAEYNIQVTAPKLGELLRSAAKESCTTNHGN